MYNLNCKDLSVLRLNTVRYFVSNLKYINTRNFKFFDLMQIVYENVNKTKLLFIMEYDVARRIAKYAQRSNGC